MVSLRSAILGPYVGESDESFTSMPGQSKDTEKLRLF